MKDQWDVEEEKRPYEISNLNYRKIDPSGIQHINKDISPNRLNLKQSEKIIIIEKRPYKEKKSDIQQAFNSNIKISNTAKEPQPRDPPQGYMQRKNIEIDLKKITVLNSSSINDSQRSSGIQLAPGSNLIPENQSEASINLKMRNTKLKFFAEAFSDIPRKTIENILNLNKNSSDNDLYEMISRQRNKFEPDPKPLKSSNNLYKRPCPDLEKCSNFFCEYFHCQGEKRRVLDNYSIKMCKDSSCSGYNNCDSSHTLTEVYFHPSVYKMLSCPYNECPFKSLCRFSHEIEKKNKGLLELLEGEFEDVLSKKKNTQEVYQTMNMQIEEFQRERLDLRKRLVCCICDIYRIEFATNCSHIFCGICIQNFQNGICPKCKKISDVIKIDYS